MIFKSFCKKIKKNEKKLEFFNSNDLAELFQNNFPILTSGNKNKKPVGNLKSFIPISGLLTAVSGVSYGRRLIDFMIEEQNDQIIDDSLKNKMDFFRSNYSIFNENDDLPLKYKISSNSSSLKYIVFLSNITNFQLENVKELPNPVFSNKNLIYRKDTMSKIKELI